VTNAMRKASALLTFCSVQSLPSGPEGVAHFACKREESSVGPLSNDSREIISDSYALNHRYGAISFQTFPAHRDPSRPKYVAQNMRAQLSVGPHDIDPDRIISYTYSLPASRMCNPGPNVQHISSTKEHNCQLVRVTKLMAESSASLTSCSTKSEPSDTENVAHFDHKSAQSSVGQSDIGNIVTNTYDLQYQAPSAPEYMAQVTARERDESSVGPRDKDHRNSARDTHAL
jgi:hypothetical protein